MSTSIEHTDPYRQRYVTTTELVTSGLQVTTEIYTPYVVNEPIESRSTGNASDGSRSIEVFGQIQTIIQTLGPGGEIIAEGCGFESTWIEVWHSCMAPVSSKFAYTMDCCIVGAVDNEVIMGAAFISPGNTNNVVWADVDGTGAVLAAGTGELNFEFIDVWS
jgi:hypothetical protein